MPATIEHLASLIRVGEDHEDVKEPFEVALSATWLAPDRVMLMGLDQKLRPSHWKAIYRLCQSLGVRQVVYERLDGETREVDVRPRSD